MKVLVYGTLMRGQANYGVMQRAQGRFVNEGMLKDKDIYYAYRKGSFPAVVDGKGYVLGEIFEIPETKVKTGWGDKMYPIQIIDQLEGYSPNRKSGNMYVRKRAQAILPNGEKIWVSYYHWNGNIDRKLKIKSGDWASEI